MSKGQYYRIALSGVPRESEEALSQLCFEHGASGVCEELDFQQNPEDYSVETLVSDLARLEIYFEHPPAPSVLDEIRARFPEIQCELFVEDHKDWLKEWKKGFEAFSLVGPVWVCPSWRTPPPEAKSVIWMEPGMAFGTGTHATTRIAARLLHKSITTQIKPSLLDVGTGTGILAMLGLHLGAGHVMATEIDSDSRRVARENLSLNKMDSIEVSEVQAQDLTDTFDVVVANIIDGVLVQLQKTFYQRLKPGGLLVLSGILEERDEIFCDKFHWERWQKVERVMDEEWVGYLLRRR